MSAITKERVANLLQFNSEGSDCQSNAEQWEVHELARIALASLEAEPYGYVHKAAYEQAGSCGLSSDHEAYRDSSTHIAVYANPPAPVSVPDEVLKRLLPDAEKAEFWFEHDGKILFEGVKFNNAVFEACRAAMLQGAENAETPTTMQTAPALDSSPKNAESASGNSPVIPDGWVACSDRLPDPDSAFRVCAYTPTPHEDFRFRSVPASLFKSVCRDATHWQYMLPPAAPQQEVKP